MAKGLPGFFTPLISFSPASLEYAHNLKLKLLFKWLIYGGNNLLLVLTQNDVFCWDDLPISDILCEWSIHSSFLTSASPIPLSYLVVSDGLLDSQHCTGQLWSLECEPLIMALACNISANVSAKDPLVFYYSRHYHFHSNHGHCYFWYFLPNPQ